MDHFWSYLTILTVLNQNRSKMAKMAKIRPYGKKTILSLFTIVFTIIFYHGQKWAKDIFGSFLTMVKMTQNCHSGPFWSIFGHIWPYMIGFGLKRSKTVKYDQKWSKNVQNDHFGLYLENFYTSLLTEAITTV